MPDKQKIAILTTARSDFGPLKRIIRHAADRFDLDLLVAGSHFLVERGETFREIEAEFGACQQVNIIRLEAMSADSSPLGQVDTLARTQQLASRWFAGHPYEALLFLGDRWELWGVTLAAFMHGIPLAHISGGEVTEGVIDDCVRHAHTKISGLHFAATTDYARNLSRMGEEDWRISVVGECGLDLIHDAEMASAEEVRARFGIDLDYDTILVTFHPSTLDHETPVEAQIGSLLEALAGFPDHRIVFTAPGVEVGSDQVLEAIRAFVAARPNCVLVDHLGSRNYLAVMNRAKAVVGNSSSGLVEASSFGVPAINVGQRQKNRMAADSVQHTSYASVEIRVAIERALGADYQAYARQCVNPYDPYRDGKNSLRIVDALDRALRSLPRAKLRVKKFDTEAHPEQWNYLLKEDLT
jgi:GDP/UDP-N,N'-diacetylbacillosamine 2-epimerase (hydrolysing)